MFKPESIDPEAVFDLPADDQLLRRGDHYLHEGHAARTLVREDALRVVLIAMRAGARIAEHAANATVMIHALTGQVRLHVAKGGRTVQLESGRVLVLERGTAHDVEAVVDSTLLVTLGWRPKEQQ